MKKLATLALVLALSGCAAMKSSEQAPVGVGGDTDDLKRSPCACGEPFYRNGVWVE